MKRVASLRGAELLPIHAIGYRAALLVFSAGAAIGFGGSVPAQVVEATEPEISSGVVERGEDFAVYQRVVAVTDATGGVRFETNRFTLLENALHYFEDGQWKESEDLIEPFPDGAIARRGPQQAIFSADLNSEAVFDIATADGQRLRGGVRQIQVTDLATGKSQVLASVKESVPGEILPPNQVIYRSGFDGADADVLFVWRHNWISQNVILKEQPALPDGMDPATTRLEVVSELVECPEPVLAEIVVKEPGKPDLLEHVTIGFGPLLAMRGKAFAVAEDRALVLTGDHLFDENAISVVKQFHQLQDGRKFILESVSWQEIQPLLKALPTAERADNSRRGVQHVVQARLWPQRVAAAAKKQPLQVASLAYHTKGFLVDFTALSGSTNGYYFRSGETYYIASSFTSLSSGLAAFEPNSVIKFNNNAWLNLAGAVSFPASSCALPVVFTSKDDDSAGELLTGISDHVPNQHAAPAIWFSNTGVNTTVRSAQFRWAKRGIDYYPVATTTHCLSDSYFRDCQTGVTVNSGTVYLTNVKKCNVTTPITGSGGYWSGTMTTECGVVSVARVNDPAQDSASGDPNKNSQSECSFVLADCSRVVAAFFDTHLSAYGLGDVDFRPAIPSPRSTGWAVSVNGGASFTDKGALPPTSSPQLDATTGDAGDPVLARNTIPNHPYYGHIYLLANPSREGGGTWKGFRLWRSTDNGQTFSWLHGDIFGGSYTKADKPMIAVNNFPNLSNSGYVYAAGKATGAAPVQKILVTYSTDSGVSWTPPTQLDPGFSPDIAIRPDGTVYVFYFTGSGSQQSIKYQWLPAGSQSWQPFGTVPVHPDNAYFYSVKPNASGWLKRTKFDPDPDDWSDDYFDSHGFPRLAVNSVRDRIYLVYADLPFAGSTADRGDVFVQEASPNPDGSLNWSGQTTEIKLSDNSTDTDQWCAAVTVNPQGTVLFIGYYSRQEDITNNAMIKAYGAKATITGGLVGATFDVFPISTTAFEPFFSGSTSVTPPADTWRYDHVWTQYLACFDQNGLVLDPCPEFPYGQSANQYQHFRADEYTWAAADGSYFYYAWRDCVDTFGSGQQTRPDANVRFAKIRQ